MASNIRYRAEYYNTTGTSTFWTIEICDTEAVGQVIYFEAFTPSFDFEGLTQDLKSGIFPSRFKFGMAIRTSPRVIYGNTHGPHEAFVQDLFDSNEGRFRVKVYWGEELYFIGVIMPDQCSFEDMSYPYRLDITAVDGLYRLQSEDYVSQIGLLKKETITSFGIQGSEFSSTPLPPPSGSGWVMIEHVSNHYITSFNNVSTRETTYARMEQYALLSPGTGWVDEGGNLWILTPTYSNEIVVDEATYYHLTRDIDDTPFRTLHEVITRAMEIIPTWDEYDGVMFDVVNTWYDLAMWDLTVNPFTQIRWSERKYAIGKKWSAVIEMILKHFYCRLYYANGRYHIEQISERGNEDFTRYAYDADGVLVDTEATNLDITYSALTHGPETGGSYKFLAALRSAEVKLKFDSNNLLLGYYWNMTKQGTEYLARVRTTENDTRFKFVIPIHCIATFYNIPPSLGEEFTAMNVEAIIRVRVVNVVSSTTYHLTPVSQTDHSNPTWEEDEAAGYFSKSIYLSTTTLGLVQRMALYTFAPISAELPGNAGDSFDVFVSITFSYAFLLQNANQYFIENPDNLALSVQTKDASLTTVDVNGDPVDSSQEKVFEAVNSRDNTVVHTVDAQFSDEGILGNAIQIRLSATPESWGRSSGQWNRNGDVNGSVELLQLLAQEICSLRTVPLRVFSGAFITNLITPEHRINRNSIIYMPLSLQVNTDVDSCGGEFVNLERATPPNADIIDIPFDAGEDIVAVGPADVIPETDPPIVLETDQIIGAGSTLTQCAIVNTMEATIAAGEVVRITNPEVDDEYETVTLTEHILPDSVIMYFVSHMFVNGFPDASPITIQIEASPPGFPGMPFNIDLRGWTDDISVEFPGYYQFPDPEENSPVIINDKIKILRDGVEMRYLPGAASATPAQNRIHLWDIDYADRVATFPIPFDDERLTIRAK